LPKELASLPNLDILILAECNLPFIPPVVWMCRKLKVLDISRNKINMLVPDISNLDQLQHLNAQQTSIITLPPEIALCQNLEEILLWGNVIENLPETLRELPKLKVLAINFRSFCGMVDAYREELLRKGQIQSEHIPQVLFEMPALDTLDLNQTKLNTLPEECAGRLKELFLAQNFFNEMPNMILRMDTLQVLDLSDNMIKSIPDQIGDLVNLQQLKMSNNHVTIFPASICKLEKLESLFLERNQIQSLPDDIGKLTSLKTLVLERNSLHSIPSTIVELEKLETLDLTENKIASLPLNFYLMKNLKRAHTYKKFYKYGLWLHLNPITVPPQNVWKTEDPQNIYNYMKRLEIRQTKNLRRQKLFLLGETQCGKTSLVKSMIVGKSIMTTGPEDSTALIEFYAWKTENGVDFLVHDLGGADVYQITHQLFLDPKGMYLLVYNHSTYTPERHHDAIGKWLELLQLHTPGVVVQVIGTHTDICDEEVIEQTKAQIEEQLLKDQEVHETMLDKVLAGLELTIRETSSKLSKQEYDHLMQQKVRMVVMKKQPLRIQKSVITVSSTTGIKGIPNLVNHLEVMGVDKGLFPDAQRQIPASWFRYHLALKKRKAHYLTIDYCRQVARDCGVKKDSITDCTTFLADCGEILWFRKYQGLKNLIYPRPCNLVEILRGIFRHDTEKFLDFDVNRVFACKGKLTRTMFDEAKEHLLTSGQISRPMLKCMWFYLPINDDVFDQLLDLLPNLDLCYTIPQPDFPNPTHIYTPLLVVPGFNIEPNPQQDELSEIWPYPLPAGQSELTLNTQFPLIYPQGLFEKLSSHIQEKVVMRMDWQKIIFAELDAGAILLECKQEPTDCCSINIKARGVTSQDTRQVFVLIAKEFLSLLPTYNGLVWHCTLGYNNCDKEQIQDCLQLTISVI